jgi:hypothetical protein
MLSVVLLATVLAGPASAKGPIIEPLPADDFIIPAGGACSFPISVEFTVNGEKGITCLDDEGNFVRQIVTGALAYRLTNLSTGTSITLNIPGPGIVTPNLDGSVTITAHGPWVLFDPFGTHIYNAGRSIFIGTFDPDLGAFRIDIESQGAHSFDLCEALS